MSDDIGSWYVGQWIGGWAGRDAGAHIGFMPALDPGARQLQVSFMDPVGEAGPLTTVVAMPNGLEIL